MTTARPLIKICGVTDEVDARDAVQAGADLIGLNFFPGSSRALLTGAAESDDEVLATQLAETRLIADAVRHAATNSAGLGGSPREVELVAVFVDAPEHVVRAVIREVAPDVLQFHGDEHVDYCRGFRRPFMKAHRLASAPDVARIPHFLGGDAKGYLIDAYVRGQHGGTGRLLDDELVAAGLAWPGGFLAGGLKPENVGAIVATFSPHGVDVASGVELRPRTKSRDRMVAFVNAVEAAARQRADTDAEV